MNIAIIGYGKMGKTIEAIAEERGHNIALATSKKDIRVKDLKGIDVAIEFTHPDAAINNLNVCLDANVPIVCGTTGWLKDWSQFTDTVKEKNGAFFYASNFSLGVNIFFELNQKLARMMKKFPEYKAGMEEIHHIHKKDAPSGTAITLAEGIINNHPGYDDWILEKDKLEKHTHLLGIRDIREGEVPGTHTIMYDSPNDSIRITHEAHNRHGFALGAVIAAEWLPGRKGVFGMKSLLNL